jgi:hypothetical protein
VTLHDRALVGRQRIRLAQDVVGDRDLADVVHRARAPQQLGLVAAEPGRQAELLSCSAGIGRVCRG